MFFKTWNGEQFSEKLDFYNFSSLQQCVCVCVCVPARVCVRVSLGKAPHLETVFLCHLVLATGADHYLRGWKYFSKNFFLLASRDTRNVLALSTIRRPTITGRWFFFCFFFGGGGGGVTFPKPTTERITKTIMRNWVQADRDTHTPLSSAVSRQAKKNQNFRMVIFLAAYLHFTSWRNTIYLSTHRIKELNDLWQICRFGNNKHAFDHLV